MTTTDTRAFFVDSNILVYAYDATEQRKREVALDVVEALTNSGRAIISTQTLGEFYSSVTRKQKLAPPIAAALVDEFLAAWSTHEITIPLVLAAVRAAQTYQMTYYDALIWATAKQHGAQYILTEDRQSRPVIEGVSIINPFAPDFDMARLS